MRIKFLIKIVII